MARRDRQGTGYPSRSYPCSAFVPLTLRARGTRPSQDRCTPMIEDPLFALLLLCMIALAVGVILLSSGAMVWRIGGSNDPDADRYPRENIRHGQ